MGKWFLAVLIMFFAGCSAQQETQLEESVQLPAADNEYEKVQRPEKEMPVGKKRMREMKEEPLQSVGTYRVKGLTRLVPQAGADPHAVLLTIDDAPKDHALEMAKTLKEHGVGAIFFVNGHFLDSKNEQEILKKIVKMGFSVGNHTMHHTNLQTVSQTKQKEEILRLNDVIESIIGEKPRFFRAPHGANTDYALKLARENSMIAMNWSYGYDWMETYRHPQALTEIMLNTPLLGDGAILLFHDLKWTAKALEQIVLGLKEKGFHFVDPATIRPIAD